MPCPALRVTAFSLLVVYLAWNLAFLVQRRLAPSLMLALTGLPSPTTGMTRSLTSLWHGNVGASLRWNPLAVPMALLFCLCIGWLSVQWACRRRLVLPRWVLWCWAALLGMGWIIKLAMGTRTW